MQSHLRSAVTLWNPDPYNPLEYYPEKPYVSTRYQSQTNYVRLSSVNISCTGSSFNSLKITSAFWMPVKEQLSRSAVGICFNRYELSYVKGVIQFRPVVCIDKFIYKPKKIFAGRGKA